MVLIVFWPARFPDIKGWFTITTDLDLKEIFLSDQNLKWMSKGSCQLLQHMQHVLLACECCSSKLNKSSLLLVCFWSCCLYNHSFLVISCIMLHFDSSFVPSFIHFYFCRYFDTVFFFIVPVCFFLFFSCMFLVTLDSVYVCTFVCSCCMCVLYVL